MPFAELPEQADAYVDRNGEKRDLSALDNKTREALVELIRFYNWNPPYPQFKTYWRDKNSPIGPHIAPDQPHSRLLKGVAKDMETRLGVAQGRLEE